MYHWSLLVCSLLYAYSNNGPAQNLKTVTPSAIFSSVDLEEFRPAGVDADIRPADVLPEKYAQIVVQLSTKYDVSWQLVASIMQAESNFKTRATSARGARGLMQLTPQTAARYQVSAKELYDPYKNIEAGIKHLKMLIDRYSGNLELAVAAYNTGEFAVDRYGGVPPFRATRYFVKKVLAALSRRNLTFLQHK
jgi:soluble lytic murein transglycosylase-like protein